MEALPRRLHRGADCQWEPVPVGRHFRFRAVGEISKGVRLDAAAHWAASELLVELALAQQKDAFLEVRPGVADQRPVGRGEPGIFESRDPTDPREVIPLAEAHPEPLLPDAAYPVQPDVERQALRVDLEQDFDRERRQGASEHRDADQLAELRVWREPKQQCHLRPARPKLGEAAPLLAGPQGAALL